MASSFMGLYVQRDGLNLAQKALDLTGSNISNTQTPGYTRQRLDVVSVKNNNYTLGYVNQVFLAGAGADAEGVTQIRDEILDTKFRRYTSVEDDLSVKSSVLSDIEDAIDDIENSESGFAASIEAFKAAWQSFSSVGTDQTDIANVALNAAENVVNVLRNFDMRISSISDDTLTDTKTGIKRVNEILEQCAALNKDIKAGYVNNNNVYDNGYGYQADTNYGPLEVKDLMNSLIDELAGYADISSTVEKDGTFTITIAGKDAVKNDEYAKLTLDKDIVREKDADGNETGEITFNDKKPTDLSFSISDLHTEKKWKIMRWETEGVSGDDLKARTEINNAVEAGDFDAARNLEDEYIGNSIKNANAALSTAEADFNAAKTALDAFGTTPDETDPDYITAKNNYDAAEAAYNSAKAAQDSAKALREDSLFMKEDPSTYVMTDIISGGALRGLVDMYNGEGYYTSQASATGAAASGKNYYTNGHPGNIYKGIPYYKDVIDSLATAVVEKFDEVYSGVTNEKGEEFRLFEFTAGLENKAEGLKTAEVWKDNPIRSVHPTWSKDKIFDGSDPDSSQYDELSNEWINKILSVFEAKHDIGEESLKYKFEDYVSHYGNTVGSQLEGTNKMLESNTILLNSVDDARDAVMKVSTDEEGINMLTYQKWYNAMARMVTTLDSALDKLINNTGVVGL